MKLYHGSNIGGIQVLEPRQADHDRPYVYLSASKVVAAFYLCNAVEKPYYWFPYGFDRGGSIPIYHELYPDALRQVSEGIRGYIYEVEAGENQVIPFQNIPCARLATGPVEVTGCLEVADAYKLFSEYVEQGEMRIGRFEDKSEQELGRWYSMIKAYLKEKELARTPDCSYAVFVRDRFPGVWEEYLREDCRKS